MAEMTIDTFDGNDRAQLGNVRVAVAGLTADVKNNREILEGKIESVGDKVDVLHYALEGNGKPGLRQRVERMEGMVNKVIGAVAVIVILSKVLEWALPLLTKGLHL